MSKKTSLPTEPPVHCIRLVRAQFRRAKNNLLTGVAVIRDAEKGDEISSNQIRRYCDEAVRAIEEVEFLRSNAELSYGPPKGK